LTIFGSLTSITEILPLVGKDFQDIPSPDMITDKEGEAASKEIERWAGRVLQSAEPSVNVSVYYDPDSGTYVIRLARSSRVLLFRLSAAQVRTPEREIECEELLRKKMREL
jgi:hypothetical protein